MNLRRSGAPPHVVQNETAGKLFTLDKEVLLSRKIEIVYGYLPSGLLATAFVSGAIALFLAGGSSPLSKAAGSNPLPGQPLCKKEKANEKNNKVSGTDPRCGNPSIAVLP